MSRVLAFLFALALSFGWATPASATSKMLLKHFSKADGTEVIIVKMIPDSKPTPAGFIPVTQNSIDKSITIDGNHLNVVMHDSHVMVAPYTEASTAVWQPKPKNTEAAASTVIPRPTRNSPRAPAVNTLGNDEPRTESTVGSVSDQTDKAEKVKTKGDKTELGLIGMLTHMAQEAGAFIPQDAATYLLPLLIAAIVLTATFLMVTPSSIKEVWWNLFIVSLGYRLRWLGDWQRRKDPKRFDMLEQCFPRKTRKTRSRQRSSSTHRTRSRLKILFLKARALLKRDQPTDTVQRTA